MEHLGEALVEPAELNQVPHGSRVVQQRAGPLDNSADHSTAATKRERHLIRLITFQGVVVV